MPRSSKAFLVPALSLVITALPAILISANASSTDAWQQLADKMRKACLAKAELKSAKLTWSDLYFENQAVALIDGRWPQKHMNNQRGAMLCLYDKKTGKVEVQEFDVRLLK
ncbi:hypothetical protein ACFPL7_04115 [Dongia soli]|uniref:Uncharacterized protein n=1 Tax=Dongia soli TaxID=600628 RepID=A0ABU5EGE8_9PROT|nr:hypothetical protein [Dongia soli]MDY0884523.1 hypothetical protein [Dongia soli]